MSVFLDEMMNLIKSRPNRWNNGWLCINCPECGDKRQRGGFMTTPTGGWRYHCFNGGCTYSTQATGWEEGNGISGKVKQLFERLGGDINRIPAVDRLRKTKPITDKTGKILGYEKRLPIAGKFTEIVLPKGTHLLEEAAEDDSDAEEVLAYLYERSPLYLECDFPFLWTPKYPEHLIIPFIHFGKVVGYLGRNINKKSGANRFIQRVSPDYMFNQHLLTMGESKTIFVMESPMDAILLRGIGTRSNNITERQGNLLKISNKNPILIPDQCGTESLPFYHMAKEQGWAMAVPDWPYKDAGEAITKIGLLSTIKALTTSVSTNYMHIRGRLGIQNE